MGIWQRIFGPDPEPQTIVVAQEAIAPVDPDDHLYRATQHGLRDLTGPVLNRAQNISIDLYRKNPLANRIIKIYTSYMAGDGFAISCDNPEVQAVCDEFWNAERNQMPINHRRFARDFLLNGEAPHPVAIDETGNTTVGYIDPYLIDHVTTNKNNRLILEQVLLNTGGQGETLDIVRRVEDPLEEDAGLLTGEVFLWLYDRIGGATRGTPFLLPAIDWLDAYDQTLWEMLERMKAARAFFWDVEVDGGAAEVEDAKTQWGTTAPRSGSVRFRSNAMRVAAEQPNIGIGEDVSGARYLLRHISTAAGLAPHWLGEPEDANRSTAEQMDKPVLKALEETQAGWQINTTSLLQYVVDRKVAAGMLPRIVERHDEQGQPTGDMVPASSTVEVIVPALTDNEMAAAAASLFQVAQAFAQLDMIDGIDRETIRNVVRRALPALGIPADELPDPNDEDTSDEEILQALESIQREATRTGSLQELNARL